MIFVEPALVVVLPLVRIESGEKTGRVFFRIAKIFAQNAGSICEVNDVIAEEDIVLDDVPDESAEKCDVAATRVLLSTVNLVGTLRSTSRDPHIRKLSLTLLASRWE